MYSIVFVACGLNYKTAPLNVREKLAFSGAMHDTMLNSLVGLPTVNEAAILSTCNRTEIYCETDAPESIIPWLASEHNLSPDALAPYFYLHQGHQGIRHTLSVASGLDSMMLGEPQILGQMKQAYQHACRLGTVKTNLRHVFPYVFSASKRIRNHSGIGNNPISIAFAAVQLIGKFFSDYKSLNVFIIGSGETASLVAKYLHRQGVERFMVANRNHENANNLAAKYAGLALTIGDIPHHLAHADVIISATACPLPFINQGLVKHALEQRKQKPMFFLDLAVPRDIEADVGELAGVQLYNIDNLHTIITKGMAERQMAAKKAEHLVDCELENYIRWHRSLRAKNIICDYRNQMHDLAQLELKRAKQKLAAGQCQHTVLSEFSERLVKKLMHSSTVGLRQAASDNRQDVLDLAHYLFTGSENLTPL